jgi:hypothetical protein
MLTRRGLSRALWIGKKTRDGEKCAACDARAAGAGVAASRG